jgi:hypothetical protein
MYNCAINVFFCIYFLNIFLSNFNWESEFFITAGILCKDVPSMDSSRLARFYSFDNFYNHCHYAHAQVCWCKRHCILKHWNYCNQVGGCQFRQNPEGIAGVLKLYWPCG